MDTALRSLAKSLSWRVLGIAFTSSIVWVATGRVGLAAMVGAGEFVLKLAAYYAHERLWNRVPFGRPAAQRMPTTEGSL